MIVAVDSGPHPELPSHVLQALEKFDLNYRTCQDRPDLPAAQRVQSVLLEDAIGMLLVLFPRDRLLDLTLLAELTGRQLTAAKHEKLQQLLARQALNSLPGLPQLLPVPCLYEASLMQQPTLWIESGQPGLLLEFTLEDLRSLMEKASSGHFGVVVNDIRPNLNRPHEDQAEIIRAVESFTARRIRQRLEETIEIPPLPQSANRIIRLRVDPKATVEDITNLVETDPALAAQVVSWAASPYYASPSKVRSVEDAIVRVLGFDIVINLALGLALGKTITLPKDEPQQSTPYWQQAIYTATVIDGLLRIMPRAQRPESGMAYLCGLLHNFGYLVLAHVFPPHFSLICRHREVNPHLHHSQIEQHLLGITREQIGAWMMQHWGMPEELYTALRFQNDLHYQGEYALYPNLIWLTVRLLGKHGIGSDPDQNIPDELYEKLGIDRQKADEVVQKVFSAETASRELARQMNPVGPR